MTNDMRHMEYLESVVEEDIEILRSKEATYQGSWKAAGGRSAWFMARRNMDRLLEMMKPPKDPPGFSLEETVSTVQNSLITKTPMTPAAVQGVEYLRDSYTSENIFAMIRRNPRGEDGTVLAVMRDLRRYLILVEAEMIARGVTVAAIEPIPPSAQTAEVAGAATREIKSNFDKVVSGGMVYEAGQPPVKMKYICRGCDQEIIETAHRWIEIDPLTGLTLYYHSECRRAPWAVTFGYFAHNQIPPDLCGKFWRKLGMTDTFVLEPHVLSSSMPRILQGLYMLRGDHWIIKIDQCPALLREHFPSLPLEQNMKEWEERPQWQRPLYTWNEKDMKYVISDQARGWMVEP